MLRNTTDSTKSFEDPAFEAVSSLFRILSGKKITDAGSFQSLDGHPGIKAILKTIQRDHFLLEKCILLFPNTPLLIELVDIHRVFFSPSRYNRADLQFLDRWS